MHLLADNQGQRQLPGVCRRRLRGKSLGLARIRRIRVAYDFVFPDGA
jgi:hypothetical protein